MPRLVRFLLSLLAVALVVGGTGITWVAFHSEPDPAPVPDAPIAVGADVAASGPGAAEVADIDGGLDSDDENAPRVRMGPENMRPNRLLIPSIGTYARMDDNPIRDGLLVLDKNPTRLTRWVDGAAVGDSEGTVLVTGHVSYNGRRGSLYSLSRLKAGNLAYVSGPDGKVNSFKLVGLKSYRKASLPDSVWSPKGERRLVVVTCGGKIIRKRHGRRSFSDNVVATFVPA